MRTISIRVRKPSREYPVLCGYCGVPWPRHRMFRDQSGIWVCPDDAAGEDVVSLSLQNAADARARRHPVRHHEGAPPPARDVVFPPGPPPPVADSVDIFDDPFDDSFN